MRNRDQLVNPRRTTWLGSGKERGVLNLEGLSHACQGEEE